jgi:DNA-binding transcriptional LysR family regulator
MKYFAAVCEAGTVSAAAELLHISQPSLSAAIKELEAEFGTALFKRTHKGMLPTEEGALFLSLCRDVVARAESAEKRMKSLGCNKTALSLGVPPMIGSLILPALYRDFVRQNADVDLDIFECGREEMLKKIREGALDMAFIPFDTFSDPGLCLLELGELSIVCAAAAADPLCQKSVLTPADLDQAPLVTFKEGFFQTQRIRAWFLKGGAEPRILTATDQLSTMLRMIESGTAVGCLFDALIEKESAVKAIPLAPAIPVQVGLAYKKDKYISDGMRRFKDFTEKTALF